jgi:phosphatidylglycerophosphatase A
MGGCEIILALAFAVLLSASQALQPPSAEPNPQVGSRFLVWLAQGFGIGRIPFAPGTFGSVLGLVWFGLLLASGQCWMLLLGTAVGLALSVWLCGVAETALQQKDPGSVVLDEIAAMPVCFLAALGFVNGKSGSLPGLADFFYGNRWLWIVGIFAAFRFFDVLKPWPVRQSQALPGGWGITVDDVLAALYVNLLVVVIEGGKDLFAKL